MGISGGGLYLAMAEEFADHRQTLADGQATRREGVPKIMEAR